MADQKRKIIGIIPARFGSIRLPGKPLVDIKGKPLIQHTYENALKADFLDDLIVATDDNRILSKVQEFGGKAAITPDCPTGTDRLAWLVKNHAACQGADIIVNIQGDEPDIDPSVIQGCIKVLLEAEDASIATPIVRIKNKEDAESPSVVKCVTDTFGYALYFSRSLIPHNKSGQYRSESSYFKHIGLYAYRKEFLLLYPYIQPTPLQLEEDLEQLKVLEMGYRIKTYLTDHDSLGIDTEHELQTKLERMT